MSAQAWFEQQHHEVLPGDTVTAVLNVRNIGIDPDTFAITPFGMAAAFTTVTTPIVTLFGGETMAIEVEIRPPRLPNTTAGPVSLSVRIVPHDSPDDVTYAETGVEVVGYDECRMGLLQPVLRSRRRALFELAIENGGNATSSYQLRYVDPSGRTDGYCDPPSIIVEPGTTGLCLVRVRAQQIRRERSARSIPFRIDALESGDAVASTGGTFVQAPLLPERFNATAGSVVGAVLVLLLAWIGVVRPAIRGAADDAVSELAVPVNTAAPTGGDGGGTSSGGSDAVTGDVLNLRLPVTPAPGETLAATYEVPSGRTLRITDVIVQNPQLDQGLLVVARGDEVLLTYNLANVFTDLAVPFLTPLTFEGGDVLTVSATCSGLGDAASATCAPAVLVSGLLTD